jgi:hypothetical protein
MFRKLGLRLSSKKANKINSKKRSSVNFELASHVGILLHSRFPQSVAKQLVSELKSYGKDVTILYYNSSKSQRLREIDCVVFNRKDFKWNGKIKSEILKKFVKTDFDFLFSLNTSPFLPFENILARSVAKCRVGQFTEKQSEYYELMIHTAKENDTKELAQQMLYYSKMIKN